MRPQLMALFLAVSSTDGLLAQMAVRDPFAVPTATAVCRTRRAAAGMILVDFADGEDSATAREITAAFDTSGTPYLIGISLPAHTLTGGNGTRVFAAAFLPVPQGLGRFTYADSTHAPEPREPMSDAEMARARGLALYLWSSSCPRNPQVVVPPGPPKRDTTQPVIYHGQAF